MAAETGGGAGSRARGYARGRARRAQILDAALEVFGQHGYTGTSLRDVAQRSGLSHPGLLHHFPSKELLLAAVLERRDELDLDRFLGSPEDPLQVLDGWVAVVENNARTPGLVELYCVLSAEATSPAHPAHGFFCRRYAGVTAQLERAFRNLEEQGRLRGGPPAHELAVRTVALVDGLQVQWLLSGGAIDMAAQLRDFLDRHLA